MALIMERVDLNTICLAEMWRSNTMLRYLHTMDEIFTQGLDIKTFHHSTYALIPPSHVAK